jgi:hypothetical protein
MRRSPLLLRGRADPLDRLGVIVERGEKLAGDSRVVGRANDVGVANSAIVAAGIDGWRVEAGDVEVLADSELASIAERAGIEHLEIGGADTERLRGVVIALRGAAGEHWVFDGLGRGALPMPAGTRDFELQDFTRPGIDVVFSDASGEVVETANVKIASSAAVVLEHFRRHPHVRIVYASSDAAQDAGEAGLAVVGVGDVLPLEGHVVVDIGRPSARFDDDVVDRLPTAGDASHDVLDLFPWFSTGTIAVRALLRLQRGVAPLLVARQTGRESVVAGAGFATARLAARATTSEPTVAIIAMLSSTLTIGLLDVRRDWVRLTDPLALQTARAEALVARTAERLLTLRSLGLSRR